jgi:serine/threonine protein phosphatase PrpC
MMQDWKPSPHVISSLKQLLDAMRIDKVPDPGPDFMGLNLKSLGLRRVLFLVNCLEKATPSNPNGSDEGKDAPATSATVSLTKSSQPDTSPSVDAANSTKRDETTDAPPPPIKFVPAADFDAPPPLVVEAAPSPAAVVPDASATGEASAKNPEFAATAAPKTGPSPQAAPAPRNSPSIGGIPSMPIAADNILVAPMVTMKKSLFLKNAKAGELYEGAVEMDGLKELRLEDAGGSGLDYEDGLLKGIPKLSGDFVLRFQGLLHGKRVEISANLAVIPDPKSLWVSKDSDRSDPFWKPDEDFDVKVGDLLCVAASKRGRSHAKDGIFRDDDFAMSAAVSGWHVAAVADGAGSAKLSRRGSKVAVDHVLRELPSKLAEHLDPEIPALITAHVAGSSEADANIKSHIYQSLATVAFNAAKAIEEEAERLDRKPSELSTTLIVAAAKLFPEGWFVASFSVGDGGAALIDADEPFVAPLTLPDSGEFAGQTRFLQRSEFNGGYDEVVKRIFFAVRKRATALLLMTDGITDPKFPTESVFADKDAWAKFWKDDLAPAVDFSEENPELKKRFLDWLDFWSPGNHDDRTLAVLVPRRSAS